MVLALTGLGFRGYYHRELIESLRKDVISVVVVVVVFGFSLCLSMVVSVLKAEDDACSD